MSWADRFEYATSQDPSRNYCLWDYSPAAPADDKFRSINLLFQSFDVAAMDERAFVIVEAIREAIGPFRTVFGVKLLQDRLAWELYFYDYLRRERSVSISKVLSAIRPFVRCDVVPVESLPYFMFSLDLDEEIACGNRELDVVHMYVGNPGSAVSSGIAYALRSQSTTLENFYFFFDGKRHRQEATEKVCTSAVFDATRVPVSEVMIPELVDCQTICVANKRTHDCVYFSGVNVNQLLFFMRYLGYPDTIASFVQANVQNFDHLRFDVGFDYRMEDGRLTVLKSGYYGVF